MNLLFRRSILAATVIVAGHLAAMWVRGGYDFVVKTPSKNATELPVQLGAWRGRDHVADPQVAKVLQASSHVSRLYSNSAADKISLHTAIWTEGVDELVAPHHPSICYPNAGWTIREVQNVEIDTPHGTLPMSFHLLERSGESIVSCHWYQMGSERFTDNTGARGIHRKLWGSKEWPPIVKVLMQIEARDITSARPRLEELAVAVLGWTSDIQ